MLTSSEEFKLVLNGSNAFEKSFSNVLLFALFEALNGSLSLNGSLNALNGSVASAVVESDDT